MDASTAGRELNKPPALAMKYPAARSRPMPTATVVPAPFFSRTKYPAFWMAAFIASGSTSEPSYSTLTLPPWSRASARITPSSAERHPEILDSQAGQVIPSTKNVALCRIMFISLRYSFGSGEEYRLPV